jgi:hypothetical protein
MKVCQRCRQDVVYVSTASRGFYAHAGPVTPGVSAEYCGGKSIVPVVVCTRCGSDTDPLAVFPGGLCLDCYKVTPEGRRMPTADEVVAMWGGAGAD